MNRKTYFYVGNIRTRTADHEHTEKFVFATAGRPDAFMHKLTRTWYGDSMKYDSNHQGYWNGMSELVFNDGYHKISENEFHVLSKELCNLSPKFKQP